MVIGASQDPVAYASSGIQQAADKRIEVEVVGQAVAGDIGIAGLARIGLSAEQGIDEVLDVQAIDPAITIRVARRRHLHARVYRAHRARSLKHAAKCIACPFGSHLADVAGRQASPPNAQDGFRHTGAEEVRSPRFGDL
jgi:hypothetical protein